MRPTYPTKLVSVQTSGDPEQVLRIGRTADNDLVVPDPSVSRHHARLHLQGETATIEDLGSSNGTVIAGARLEPGVPHPVVWGEPLTLGTAPAVLSRGADGRVAIASDADVPILEIPLDQRRTILVAADDEELLSEKGDSLLTRVARKLVENLYGPLAWLLKAAFSSVDGAVPPARVAIERAREELRFPPGHPRVGSAYVVHPHQHDRYLTTKTFHHDLFVEKRDELLSLLAALGARRVRLSHRTGFGWDGGTGASVPEPNSSSVIRGKIEVAQRNSGDEFFELSFGAPAWPAHVPTDLVWFEHEPTWQVIARARLEHKLSTLKIVLAYTESFGVDASLGAQLEELSIGVGAGFSKFEETRWELEVEMY